MAEDKDIAIRHAKSRYKTIVCSFCLSQVDEAFFSWSNGVAICPECLKFATDEVAKSKKQAEVGENLLAVAKSLTVLQEKKVPAIPRDETIKDIEQVLSGELPPDDVA